MTRQWIRELRLTVTTGSSSVDLSNLRIRFRVEQNNTQRPNVADVTVTNPSRDTIQKIKKEGQSITLEAGYADGYSVIFKGDLIQKRSGRENPVDTYLSLLAQSGDRAYNFAVMSKTLAAGSTYRDQVNAVAQEMKKYGVELGHIADLGSQKMPRARTMFGMARDIMRDIAYATGTSWSIQNQKLQMVKNQEYLPGQVHKINSRTGMVGMPVQTLDGIQARVLLNPRIVPGSRVEIDQSSIQEAAFSPNYLGELSNSMIPSLAEDGIYKVLVVNHSGDTRGNPYYTDIVCIRADGQGPLPLRLAGQGINLDPGAQ